jgi:hypothetical protein
MKDWERVEAGIDYDPELARSVEVGVDGVEFEIEEMHDTLKDMRTILKDMSKDISRIADALDPPRRVGWIRRMLRLR